MFQHSLLLIYRNFLRFKATFFINLIGLSIGLACTLAIYMWVNDELHFDKFHESDSRLFQVIENWKDGNGITTKPETPHQLAAALVAEMPEVAYATTATPPAFFPKFTLTFNNSHLRATGKFVGKDYLKLFSFPLVQGDADQVLSDRNALVLSEEMALKLFGTTEGIIGKTLEWETMGVSKQVFLSGILKGIPANSSEQFDFLLSFEAFEKDIMHMEAKWEMPEPFYTYIVLKEGTDLDAFNQKVAGFIQHKTDKAPHRTLILSRYSDSYLYGAFENGVQVGTRIEYVKLFSIIALIILVIACINFMNLSTAKASGRTKEVGIKKTLGASRETLVAQYLGESVLIAFLSLVLSVFIIQAILPNFNLITGKQLSLQLSTNLVLVFLGITLLTGLLAGSYPAVYLSGFNPVMVLKGKLPGSWRELVARKGLVVVQFTLSAIFLVSVLVVYKQIQYVQTKNLGYDKDNLITFEIEGNVTANAEPFLTQMRSIPGVVQASSKLDEFIGGFGGPSNQEITLEGKQIPIHNIRGNYGLIETLGIPVLSGRSFSREFSADREKKVVNESFVQALGLKDPVGKVVQGDGMTFEIIGVVKDFHYKSLHENVIPLLFTLEPESATVIMVKIEPGREKETIARIQEFYKEFNPGFVFDYRFLHADYQAQYVSEQRVGALAQYFAGLAILISSLGLYGLAAFTAEQRTKEIGIRKVLGASIASIMGLLSKDLVRLVLLAIMIATPLAWYGMSQWLENFAYRIDLAWWVFVLAGGLVVLIAFLTASFQSMKAALMNPVESLRSE